MAVKPARVSGLDEAIIENPHSSHLTRGNLSLIFGKLAANLLEFILQPFGNINCDLRYDTNKFGGILTVTNGIMVGQSCYFCMNLLQLKTLAIHITSKGIF